MALIPKAAYPDVPALPGVPQLARSLTFPPSPPPSLGIPVAIGRLWQALTVVPQWGVFDAHNNRVVAPSSMLDFGYNNEYQISTFPVQRGSFATYDKVANPFDVSLRMSKGGSQADRTQFLSDLEAVVKSLDLFTILTPERTYLNCNVTRFSVSRRGSQGAYFFADVDVFFKEIRQITPQYTSTSASTQDAQNPSAVPSVGQGLVQTQPATATFDASTSLGVRP